MRNRKYRIQKDLVFLTISMFITVFLWIASNIYDAYVTTTINETLQLQIIPIDGKFDVDTIQKLKIREVIQPDYDEITASDEASFSSTTDTVEPTGGTQLKPTGTAL